MILIIGAGITGLSAAHHLKNEDYVIVEKEAEVGGLCRSKKRDGFVFDYTGHLLHFNDPSFSSFISETFPGAFVKYERRSFIYSHGVYSPYPFQINTFGLPKDVIFECIYGFVKARLEEEKDISRYTRGEEDLSFKRWILKKFGDGFAKHFFFPFNEKLYCSDLDEISSEWTGWSIPIPSMPDVIAGAAGIRKTKVGYNPAFFYPRKGGIEILPQKLASSCKHILLNSEVDSVDLLKKEAHIRNGGYVHYDFLISTVPLNRLLSIAQNVPEDIQGFEDNLSYVKVMDLNIGFEGKLKNDFHWVYFPEKDLPFYRVGFPSNFSKSIAPDGCASLYAEVSLKGESNDDIDTIIGRTIESLIRLKILDDERKIVVKDLNIIDPAYVVFDFFRKRNIVKIITSLERAGVMTAGRFGSWNYLPMEGAFLDGRRAAHQVLSMLG